MSKQERNSFEQQNSILIESNSSDAIPPSENMVKIININNVRYRCVKDDSNDGKGDEPAKNKNCTGVSVLNIIKSKADDNFKTDDNSLNAKIINIVDLNDEIENCSKYCKKRHITIIQNAEKVEISSCGVLVHEKNNEKNNLTFIPHRTNSSSEENHHIITELQTNLNQVQKKEDEIYADTFHHNNNDNRQNISYRDNISRVSFQDQTHTIRSLSSNELSQETASTYMPISTIVSEQKDLVLDADISRNLSKHFDDDRKSTKFAYGNESNRISSLERGDLTVDNSADSFYSRENNLNLIINPHSRTKSFDETLDQIIKENQSTHSFSQQFETNDAQDSLESGYMTFRNSRLSNHNDSVAQINVQKEMSANSSIEKTPLDTIDSGYLTPKISHKNDRSSFFVDRNDLQEQRVPSISSSRTTIINNVNNQPTKSGVSLKDASMSNIQQSNSLGNIKRSRVSFSDMKLPILTMDNQNKAIQEYMTINDQKAQSSQTKIQTDFQSPTFKFQRQDPSKYVLTRVSKHIIRTVRKEIIGKC